MRQARSSGENLPSGLAEGKRCNRCHLPVIDCLNKGLKRIKCDILWVLKKEQSTEDRQNLLGIL